ncbi:MAG: sigma-70 family RNA polymerase sigma factor [Chloroflexota bacterium]|nr:MAG: sigma-70 family RNA polymerase sigma factor [Chloroflexota bacterium]
MEENNQLWQQYVEDRAPDVRHQLILCYIPLVRHIVGRMRISLPPFVDRDDIVGYGIVGLIHAIDRFDPAHGVEFAPFARQRIRGAVIDALRSCGGLSRNTVARTRYLDDRVAELQQGLGRQPAPAEVVAALGITVEGLNKLTQEGQISVISLDRPLADVQGGNLIIADVLEDRAGPSPEEFAVAAETLGALRAALKQLPARERRVLALYYYGDRGSASTLQKVAEALGVSAARACQLRSRAIFRLRRTMRSALDGTPGVPEGSELHQVCNTVAGKRNASAPRPTQAGG